MWQQAPGWHTQLFVVFYVDIFSHLNGNKSWELYKQVRAVLKTYSQPLYSMFCKYFSEFQNISKLYFSLVYKWYLVFVYLQYPAVPSCFSNKNIFTSNIRIDNIDTYLSGPVVLHTTTHLSSFHCHCIRVCILYINWVIYES